MRTRLFIVFLLLSIFPSFCQEEGKHGSHHGDLIRVFDKVKEFPIEGQIPIDYQEYTFLYASDELGSPDRILLLPDRSLFNLLSSRMEMPANWLEQRDSISVWFSTAPSRPSSVPSRLEKRIPVTFNVKKVDSSAVGSDLHMMLVSDYSSSETDFKQAEVYLIYNLSKAEITPTFVTTPEADPIKATEPDASFCGRFDGVEGGKPRKNQIAYYVLLELNTDHTCSLEKTFDLSGYMGRGEWIMRDNGVIELSFNKNPVLSDIEEALLGGGLIEGTLEIQVLSKNRLKMGNTVLKRIK